MFRAEAVKLRRNTIKQLTDEWYCAKVGRLVVVVSINPKCAGVKGKRRGFENLSIGC